MADETKLSSNGKCVVNGLLQHFLEHVQADWEGLLCCFGLMVDVSALRVNERKLWTEDIDLVGTHGSRHINKPTARECFARDPFFVRMVQCYRHVSCCEVSRESHTR